MHRPERVWDKLHTTQPTAKQIATIFPSCRVVLTTLVLAGVAFGQQSHKATLAKQKQCHEDAQTEKGEWYFGSHYSASLNACFVETILKYEGGEGGVYA